MLITAKFSRTFNLVAKTRSPYILEILFWKNTVSETQRKHTSLTCLFSLKKLRDFTSIVG